MPLASPLPSEFVRSLQALLPPSQAQALLQALDQAPATSVRYNLAKLSPETSPLPHLAPVPWASPRGFYLEERPLFAADPRWHAGGYYVQEASSMLLSLLAPLLGEQPLRALDLCAAPGGKSTLLADLLPTGSTLVSNEYVRSRAQVLQENIQKWGTPTSIVTSTEAGQLGRLTETFDLILVDAPCSGEGMFRKEEEARKQWSPALVSSCASLQREILHAIWPALRPGGLLLYSTCTFNRQENEDNLAYLVEELGASPLPFPSVPEMIQPSPLGDYPAYRMMPHQVRGEGLFCALVRKPLANQEGARRLKAKKRERPTTPPREVLDWLATPWQEGLIWRQPTPELLIALPPATSELLDLLQQEHTPILSAGIAVAEMTAKKPLPHPALALSQALARGALPEVPLDQEQAIRYLGREAITLPADTPRGIVLVTYAGLPLGFMKHLGTRANNLYPQAWRIRHPELLLGSILSPNQA